MEHNSIENEHGFLCKAGATTAFIPSELLAEGTKTFADSSISTLKALNARFASNSATFKDEAVEAENARTLDRYKSALHYSIQSVRSEAAAWNEAEVRSMQPSANYDANFEAPYISRLEALSLPDRMRATSDLNFAQSSALVRHGDIDRMGLPDELTSSIRERHQILGHIEKTGMASDYPKRATLENPLAVGVDHAAAFAAASAAIAAHRARGERVRLAADAIRSTINYLATATGQSPHAIFASLV